MLPNGGTKQCHSTLWDHPTGLYYPTVIPNVLQSNSPTQPYRPTVLLFSSISNDTIQRTYGTMLSNGTILPYHTVRPDGTILPNAPSNSTTNCTAHRYYRPVVLPKVLSNGTIRRCYQTVLYYPMVLSDGTIPSTTPVNGNIGVAPAQTVGGVERGPCNCAAVVVKLLEHLNDGYQRPKAVADGLLCVVGLGWIGLDWVRIV